MAAPHWRIWTYAQPAIVLGCSQRTRYEQLCASPGARPLEVLLRESGGGAVLTGPWMVGVSLALPIGHRWLQTGLVDSYRPLGTLLAALLNEQGAAVRTLPPAQIAATQLALAARGLPVLDWACFGNLSPWEVVDAQGCKIVGLAQRRRQTGVLLVAGLLTGVPPWQRLCDALGRAGDAGPLQGRSTDCAALGGRPCAPAGWRDLLSRGLAGALAAAEGRHGQGAPAQALELSPIRSSVSEVN